MRFIFDAEADGFLEEATQVWCICGMDIGPPHTPYSDGNRFHFNPDEIEEGLSLLSEADELIGHSIIDYDLPLLEKLYGWKPSSYTKITDTVVRSRLYKSDRRLPYGCPSSATPHGLEAWGYRVGRGKPSHDDWSVFSPDMLHRCQEDVEINHLVYLALEKEREELGCDWTDAEKTEEAVQARITQQHINGTPLDIGKVESLRENIEIQLEQIQSLVVPIIPEVPKPKSQQGTWPKKQFKKDGSATINATKYYGDGHSVYSTELRIKTAPINLASPAQVKTYLLSIGWVPIEWNYKKDPQTKKPLRDEWGDKVKSSPKLTLESLESCSWPEGSEESGALIVRHLMLAHRNSMLKGWQRDVRPDGRISAQAVSMGTPTGRMVHRRVVNVPRKGTELGEELRSCFTTVEGYTRIGIDLKSCQIYALCHYMPDEAYHKAVRDGDPHTYVQEMAGLDTRAKGKTFHYATLFGASAEHLASVFGISKVEAQLIIRRFFNHMPQLKQLIRTLEEMWRNNSGWIVGLDGRAVWVRAKHMLLCYLLQSMEAIVMKNFMNFMLDTDDLLGLDYQLVTTMHDEMQLLVLHEHVPQFKTAAYAAIEAVNAKFDIQFPQAIDVVTGKTWADCH